MLKLKTENWVDLCWFGLVRCVLVVLCSFVNKKFVHPKKSIISSLHDCLAAAWTYMKELVNVNVYCVLLWVLGPIALLV